MSAKAEEKRISSQPMETLLSVALSVPIKGDPSREDTVWGLPALFWGDPGIGKSDRVETAAARLGLQCEVAFPSTMQPEDVTGVLVPDGKGGATKICLLDSVRKLTSAGKGVLFVDELTGARPATQGAWLGAILKRQFGDVKMPPGVRIMAAANPPEQAAGGWDLEPPMANRFAHFEISTPSASEWTAYLLQQNLPREASIKDYEEVVKQNWDGAWARSQGLFAGFHNKTSGRFLHNMPAEGARDRGRAWPSPRTWEYAARSAATCIALSPIIERSDELLLEFVMASVGPGATGEFSTWLREANLPSPEDVLKNGWVPDRTRIDRNYAVFTAMTAYVLQTKNPDKQIEHAIKAYNILEVSSDAGFKDLIAPSVAALVHKGLTYSNKKIGDHAGRLLTKLGKTKVGALLKDFKE
jgi:hypothetical protein